MVTDCADLFVGVTRKNVELLDQHRKNIASDDNSSAPVECEAADVQERVKLFASPDVPFVGGCTHVENGARAKLDVSC
ncbi:hypothetical protein C7U60_03445 [Mesorhizobium plurifarium]|nr:hypothetical protein C7U60_03445 [Mesorhizobium plurifarium]